MAQAAAGGSNRMQQTGQALVRQHRTTMTCVRLV
jgi:hypothetical protein